MPEKEVLECRNADYTPEDVRMATVALFLRINLCDLDSLTTECPTMNCLCSINPSTTLQMLVPLQKKQ